MTPSILPEKDHQALDLTDAIGQFIATRYGEGVLPLICPKTHQAVVDEIFGDLSRNF